jgi:ABC-type Fe3+/spermidine/putrescine transport system ATPase subunit
MLAIRSATKRFNGSTALDRVTLSAASGETLAILGPSGAGKTTLLRAVAGLEELDAGSIEWDGKDLASVPPHKRNFGLMFQDYALFPHLDVAGNVSFGLRMLGWESSDIERRLDEVLRLVGLEGFRTRDVADLSGGEAQRVALARTLAPSPRLLMLDEPLGSLDRGLRLRLGADLAEIFDDLDLPVLFVTHDQEEAFGLADRVAILNQGRVEQIDTPARLTEYPINAWVAEFLGVTRSFRD